MARRSIFDRAREFIAGASRRVQETISTFFERSNDRDESEELREIIDFDSSSGDGNQREINDAGNKSDEEIAEDIEDSDPPTPMFPPEGGSDEDDNPDEEFESEFGFEFSPFGVHDQKDLRRIVTTFEEAVSYARDISLPPEDITIVRDPDSMLFRVRVDYEVMISE